MVTQRPPHRGCGPSRERGGVYVDIPVGPVGTPWWRFLVDPPVPVDPAALGLTPRGVTLKPRGHGLGAWDVWDWVGSDGYPNVADFVEEGRRFGFSRRISRQSDFAKLDGRSRLCLVHARGWLDNALAYAAARAALGRAWDCPTARHAGIDPHPTAAAGDAPRCCAGVWWLDLDPKTCDLVLDPDLPPDTAERVMPGFAYLAVRRPPGIAPGYRPALCLVLPIPKLVVIADPEGGAHQAALAEARQARLPVLIEERGGVVADVKQALAASAEWAGEAYSALIVSAEGRGA